MSPAQFETFLQWTESPSWFGERPLVLWGARIIPVLTITSAVLAILGRLPSTAPGLSIIAGLLLLARYRSAMADHLTSALRHGTGLRPQRQMLEQLAAATLEAPLLIREQQRGIGGIAALRALDRTLSLFEGQGSLIHAIFAALLLWDAQAIAALDWWRRRHGPNVRASLEALGTVEALAALGTLAHDNPSWRFPTVDTPGVDRLTAKRLGHPLLSPAIRVGNDVTVGPPGTLLLVTGSNMSGKSTLLRAIGLNAVLAQAGAPVCAEELTMPAVDVRTSIRLVDSLERGVSLFMAELERLKQIVDAARASSPRPLLYLLDEILHGTNTAERLIAARTVLDHLVKAGAIGAVTTHDLTLAADGALAGASRPVHFTEQVQAAANGDGTSALVFDYKLRPGLATSTNALKLLALVGLDK
jgi:hypothetical protein